MVRGCLIAVASLVAERGLKGSVVAAPGLSCPEVYTSSQTRD